MRVDWQIPNTSQVLSHENEEQKEGISPILGYDVLSIWPLTPTSFLIIVCVCVCCVCTCTRVRVSKSVPQGTCRAHRVACESQFSPSALRVPVKEL